MQLLRICNWPHPHQHLISIFLFDQDQRLTEYLTKQSNLFYRNYLLPTEDNLQNIYKGQKELVVYIIPEYSEVEYSSIRKFLLNKLPPYMIPTFLVNIERYPLNSNGKIDRNALPLPKLSEQKEIVENIKQVSAETKKLEAIYQQKIVNLEELKKSVLQKEPTKGSSRYLVSWKQGISSVRWSFWTTGAEAPPYTRTQGWN